MPDADVSLDQLLFDGGEADPEPFRFADPAFAFCLGDASGQVVADVDQALPLSGINAKERATNAAVLMDAAGAVCASAVAEGKAATFEVPEELISFRFAGVPVFLAGSQG